MRRHAGGFRPAGSPLQGSGESGEKTYRPIKAARGSSSQPHWHGGRSLALEPQRGLAWRLSDEIVSHVLDRGEVGRCVVGSDPAFVVTEDHVHHPVQAVL